MTGEHEWQRAMHLVRDELGPAFTVEVDCGPQARIVQREGETVVWRGAWVGRADIDPETLRRAERETLEEGPPFFVAARGDLLLPVVQVAIGRVRRLPKLTHAYDGAGRRASRLARLLVREHRELAAGRRSDWSARARHGWRRWLAKHVEADTGSAWVCLTSQGHTQWSRALMGWRTT